MKKILLICALLLGLPIYLFAQVENIWAKRIGGTASDYGVDVALDHSGNVYSIGKFSEAVDFNPNAGFFELFGTNLDMFIQKLDADGNFVWARRIGGNDDCHPLKIVADGTGNTYTVGTFRGTIDFDPSESTYNLTANDAEDIFILKLDRDGNLLWVKTAGGIGTDNASGITIDPTGNIGITGTFHQTIIFDNTTLTSLGGNDAFFAKLNAEGTVLWARQGGGNQEDIGLTISSDASGNFYAIGKFSATIAFGTGEFPLSNASVAPHNMYIVKIDANGSFVWAKGLMGGEGGLYHSCDIAVGASGNVYIAGAFYGTLDFDPNSGVVNLTAPVLTCDIFIQKLNTQGELVWVKKVGSNQEDAGKTIRLDACENVYISGEFKNTVDFDPNAGIYELTASGNSDIFIQKLDMHGNFVWAFRPASVMANGYISGGMNLDQSGNIFCIFTFSNTIVYPSQTFTSLGMSDAVLSKYSPAATSASVSYDPPNTNLVPFQIVNCGLSNVQSFQVKGAGLRGNLVMSAPTGYEISFYENIGYSPVLLLGVNCQTGIVPPTTVYIRLKARIPVGTYNGHVVLSAVGAVQQKLPVTGEVIHNTVLTFLGLNPAYCASEPAFDLAATPMGGRFTINGRDATQFNAATLGAGTHIVKYTYTGANDCPSTREQIVRIYPLPTLINNVHTFYEVNHAPFAIVGTPQGSTYTINGAVVQTLNPANLGIGTHTFIQTYTDANGCTNSLRKVIEITGQLTLTNTTGATCWANQNVVIDEGLTLTGGNTITSATVMFGANYNNIQDRLVYPTPMYGVVGNFDVVAGVLRLTGTATTAQYQEILRTIQYRNVSGTGYGTMKTVHFTIGDVLPFYPCGSVKPHFYKFVTAPAVTWQNARLNAETQNYYGMKGYLTTLTCDKENKFLLNAFAKNGWIGASDDISQNGAYIPSGEGQWYWVTGPEKGTRFWRGTYINGATIDDNYANWRTNQPDNSSIENFGQFSMASNLGKWNDLGNASNSAAIAGYYVEFGGFANDPIIQTTNIKKIQLAVPLALALNDTYCIDENPFKLLGMPVGGTFKIDGIPTTTLNPATLGPGMHQVRYEMAGCYKAAEKMIEIKPLPTTRIVSLQGKYCLNAPPITLAGLPAGGTFSTNGTIITQLKPAELGVGIHRIQYAYQDLNGCQQYAAQFIEVLPLPTLNLIDLKASYCISQARFDLQAMPVGGEFTIDDIPQNVFDAAALGIGRHQVKYIYKNEQGCITTLTQNVMIQPLPILEFVGLLRSYCKESLVVTLQASPMNGKFTVNGMHSTTFNPALYNVGEEVTIGYTFSDAYTCANSITQKVLIISSSEPIVLEEKLAVCPEGEGYLLAALTAVEEDELLKVHPHITYTWSNGANTRTIRIKNEKDAQTHHIIVRNNAGCVLYRIIYHITLNCVIHFAAPTAFTPNEDGINDTWGIVGKGFRNLELTIYNRWGEIIYIMRNKNDVWNGTINGRPAPAGIYVWIARYENLVTREKVEKVQGTITLIR